MIRHRVELKRYNSFGLSSEAEHFCEIDRETAALSALETCARESWTPHIVGGGSNLLLPEYVSGCVLLMRNRGIEVKEMGSDILVTAAAGENWHNLVRYCLAMGFGGIENLALIPGCVGGAPIQNIGAYGVDLESVFISLRAMSVADGSLVEFSREECAFAYRHSRFKTDLKGKYLILAVTLRLSRNTKLMLDYPDVQIELDRMGINQPSPLSVCEAVIRIRRRKLPQKLGNVGSFFKNPIVDEATMRAVTARLPTLRSNKINGGYKLSAAALIDAAGCKTSHFGGAAVWYRQPLVLVNTGTARTGDVNDLADEIQRKVQQQFDVALEIEPCVQ